MYMYMYICMYTYMYMYTIITTNTYVHVHVGAEWPAGADHREGAEEQDQGEMFEEEDEWKDYYESRGVMYDTDSERDEGIRCEREMVSESELAFSDRESQCSGAQQTSDEEQDEEVYYTLRGQDYDPTNTYIMTPFPRYMAESTFYTEEIVSWWVNM